MLELTDVSRNFGGLQALLRVNMRVEEGQIVGLIGPNGAGKTTLINNISGLDHPTEGVIAFQGVPIHNMRPHRINRMGIARTYQNIRLFSDMTAFENLLIAQHGRGDSSILGSVVFSPAYRREREAFEDNAHTLLARFGLTHATNINAGNLPYGDQRRLEVARALATNPSLILLDEPTAGMNPTETRALGEMILQLREEGISILVIEHDMSLIHQVCDVIYVLNFGRIIASGTGEEIKRNPAVIEAYLGSDEDALT